MTLWGVNLHDGVAVETPVSIQLVTQLPGLTPIGEMRQAKVPPRACHHALSLHSCRGPHHSVTSFLRHSAVSSPMIVRQLFRCRVGSCIHGPAEIWRRISSRRCPSRAFAMRRDPSQAWSRSPARKELMPEFRSIATLSPITKEAVRATRHRFVVREDQDIHSRSGCCRSDIPECHALRIGSVVRTHQGSAERVATRSSCSPRSAVPTCLTGRAQARAIQCQADHCGTTSAEYLASLQSGSASPSLRGTAGRCMSGQAALLGPATAVPTLLGVRFKRGQAGAHRPDHQAHPPVPQNWSGRPFRAHAPGPPPAPRDLPLPLASHMESALWGRRPPPRAGTATSSGWRLGPTLCIPSTSPTSRVCVANGVRRSSSSAGPATPPTGTPPMVPSALLGIPSVLWATSASSGTTTRKRLTPFVPTRNRWLADARLLPRLGHNHPCACGYPSPSRTRADPLVSGSGYWSWAPFAHKAGDLPSRYPGCAWPTCRLDAVYMLRQCPCPPHVLQQPRARRPRPGLGPRTNPWMGPGHSKRPNRHLWRWARLGRQGSLAAGHLGPGPEKGGHTHGR